MCKYCIHCIEECDGEYGEYNYKYCCEEQPSQNLKGFPFKKPPKSCIKKKLFSIDTDYYSNNRRYWEINSLVCDNICEHAYDFEKKCNPRTCEAFRYLKGRTDLSFYEKHGDKIDYREVLKGKKLTYRDNQGRKHYFKIRITEKCDNCNGEGTLDDWDKACPKCDCTGTLLKEIKLP